MTSAIGDAKGVHLNPASLEELERIGGLGHERAQRIIQNRPFHSWEDLKRIEGFGDKRVEDLKNAGAALGGQGAEGER